MFVLVRGAQDSCSAQTAIYIYIYIYIYIAQNTVSLLNIHSKTP